MQIWYSIISNMKQRITQNQMKRPKRNSSDPKQKLTSIKIFQDPYFEPNLPRSKKNSIKINRSKLPPDFFPRTESLRKQIFTTRQRNQEPRIPIKSIYRKAQSERQDKSPDKTSFFSFFEQIPQIKKNIANFMNLKREFQSRNQPKREKITLQQRNFTALSGYHRGQTLNVPVLVPATLDLPVFQGLSSSKKLRSPFKSDLISNSYQPRQLSLQDPQYEQIGQLKQIKSIKGKNNENIQNITFFNSKSVSLPPIAKNGEQR